MGAAAAFLAVRSRSVEETRLRLNHLGYPAELCDEVVTRLVTLDYLDDVAFATAWIESRDRARPRAALILRRELERKGVPSDTISGVLEGRAQAEDGAFVDADREAARRLLERRASTLWREADPRRRRNRAYALLARNGFSPDICHEVASNAFDDSADEAPGSV